MKPQYMMYKVVLVKDNAPEKEMDYVFFTKEEARKFGKEKAKIFNYDSAKLIPVFIGDMFKNPAYQLYDMIARAKIGEEDADTTGED